MVDNDEDDDQTTELMNPAYWLRRGEPSPDAELVCTEPSLLGRVSSPVIALNEGEVTIGRGSVNTVVIEAASVSREHARVFPGNGTWGIVDLGSTNGVRVNDVLVVQSWLKPGDRVSIGRIPFHFRLSEEADEKDAG